jgi:hypothetical protein
VQLAQQASHRQARAVLEDLGLGGIVGDALRTSRLKIERGCSKAVKAHLRDFLASEGWASPAKIEPGLGPELNAQHQSGVIFHSQTGNIARAFYDLMKMQSLHVQGRAPCGILVVPTTAAARRIGGNLASFDRVQTELQLLFFHQISMPVLIAGFE